MSVKLPPIKARETTIEKYFCKLVQKLGGQAYKFTSPSWRAVPDRLVVLPGLAPMFVECKAPGKTLTFAQERECDELRKLGQTVFVIDSSNQADYLISTFKKHMSQT